MAKIETVGDLRLALEGLEDSLEIMSCMQPKEKSRRSTESVLGTFAQVRVWDEGAILYSEILEKDDSD